MANENKNVIRVVSTNKSTLSGDINEQMIGMEETTGFLGAKFPGGDMEYYPPEGSDTTFNSVTVTKTTPTLDEELTSKLYVDYVVEQVTGFDAELVDGNGVHTGMELYVGSPNNTFSITAGTYHVIGEGDVVYAGIENVPLTYILDVNQTYVAIETATGDVIQSGAPFTPAQRRLLVILGVVVHTNNSTVNAINNLPDVALYTLAQLNDFFDSMNAFNIDGNVISAKGANLQLKKSLGEIFKRGSNFDNDVNDPHTRTMDSLDPVTNLRMRQYNGDESADLNAIESPLRWENNGVLEPLSSSRWGVYRVVLFPSNLIRIQYPQHQYQSLVEAQNAIQTEEYIVENNMKQNGLLRGFIIIKEGTTALNNTSFAKFIEADKFGYNIAGGAGGGITTLQGAYNNSSEPEILTDDTRQAVTIKRGSTGGDSDKVLEIKNGAGDVTAYIQGDGYISSDNMIRVRDAGESAEGVFIENDNIKLQTTSSQAVVELINDNGTNGEIRLWSQHNQCYIKADATGLNIANGGANGVKIDRPHTLSTIAEIDLDANPKVLVSREYVDTIAYPFADVKDPTGFTDPLNITVTYNATTRKVTLSGNVKALWRGQVIDALVSGWTCPDAHDDVVGNWFLFYNGAQFFWSQTPWTFDMLQISEVYYGASVTNRFGVREVHGFMDYATHANLHYNIGTWRKAGGAFTAGSWTNGSTLDADRRPILESSLVVDEDLESVITSSSTGNYCQFYLSGAGVANYTVDQADIITDAGKYRYNLNTGGTWTTPVATNNHYGKIFVVNIPVTSDAGSQKFRTLYLMPQTTSTTLSTIQAITPGNYDWGALAGAGVNEFVFVGEIIVQATSTDWVITSVSTISGNKISQITVPATTVTAQGVIDTIQTTDGFGAFVASNASVFTEGVNTHLYLGHVDSSNGIIDGNGSLVMVVDNDEISTTDGFYVRSRDVDTGVTVFQVIQNENTSTGGVPSAPQSSNTKIDNVGAKALITKEYLDAKVINTKTILVETPVDGEYFPIFQNLTGATITIQEISGTKSATGNMDVRLFKGTVFAYASGTALDTQNVTLTGTSTVYRTPVSPNTVADNEWVFLYIQGGTNSTCSVNVRYTIG